MPKKQKQAQLALSPPAGYWRSCMANRFALERDEGFTIAHFGLVNQSGVLLDHLTCIIPATTLANQRENLVQYSDKIGPPKQQFPSWRPPGVPEAAQGLGIPVVDFLYVSSGDALAEICLWNYSNALAADTITAGAQQNLQANGVGMVRCEVDLQRAFLAQLYE